MKTVFIFLIGILSLSVLFACGETDTDVVTERVDSEDTQLLLITPPDIDITHYPDGWVHLTDRDVAELLALNLPDNWWETEDPALMKKYDHASILRKFGDTRHVRFFIEARRNAPETYWNREIFIAFQKTLLFLFPNQYNKREVERILKNLPEEAPNPENLPPDRRPITIEYAEAEHAALVKKYGDVPQVQIIVDFLMKNAHHQPIIVDDVFAYRQAKFELDPNDQPNRTIYEAYLQAKADGQPLHTVDEGKIVEEWINNRKAD